MTLVLHYFRQLWLDVRSGVSGAKLDTHVDKEQITFDKRYVVRHWLRVLNCTYGELVSAVDAVGSDPSKVRQYLDEIPPKDRVPPSQTGQR